MAMNELKGKGPFLLLTNNKGSQVGKIYILPNSSFTR